jgi:hypothetical protein
LDLLYHGVELVDQFFLLLKVESLFSHTYFAGFDLLHNLDLFVGVDDDL